MPQKRCAIYARVSTCKDQRVEVQLDLLKDYVKHRGFVLMSEISDKGQSGATDKREGLQELLRLVRSRKVDVVIVTKLDRLFRSLKHMTSVIEEMAQLGVEFISLSEQIDMTTSTGKLMIQIFSAFAEFEKNLIRERTLLGLEHSRKNGVIFGRPKLYDEAKIIQLRAKGFSYRKIMTELNCPMGTVCRVLADALKSSPKKEIS